MSIGSSERITPPGMNDVVITAPAIIDHFCNTSGTNRAGSETIRFRIISEDADSVDMSLGIIAWGVMSEKQPQRQLLITLACFHPMTFQGRNFCSTGTCVKPDYQETLFS